MTRKSGEVAGSSSSSSSYSTALSGLNERGIINDNPVNELQNTEEVSIERVVCSGGGAKGVVYAGAYRALEVSGVLSGVQIFSGASAGAITAAFMATGMPTDEFRRKLLSTNLNLLMGERVGKAWGNQMGERLLTKSGKPLEDFIRHCLIETVDFHLYKLTNLSPEVQAIRDKIQATPPGPFTFRDLDCLRKEYPELFKDLVVHAIRHPGGEVQIFNSTLTPDVEVAMACRASASIPGVLQPVKITINDVEYLFMDGGMYDNLPADHFDFDDANNPLPNKKPAKTLIFAFGEGMDDARNPVFQAKFGPGDKVPAAYLATFLSKIPPHLEHDSESISLANFSKEKDEFFQSVKEVLSEDLSQEKLTAIEHDWMLSNINATLNALTADRAFQKMYQRIKTEHERNVLLIEKLRNSPLYQPSRFERYARNLLLPSLSDLNLNYQNTVRKEAGYQKLRNEYPLRTVELRVGTIKTTDFEKATKVARIMDALGYLDTMSHILNYGLEQSGFDTDLFYETLMTNAAAIYYATVLAQGKVPFTDVFAEEMSTISRDTKLTTEEKNRALYHYIKDKAEKNLDSPEAYALSRAVEVYNNAIEANDLFRETYVEGFKGAPPRTVTLITGEPVYDAITLQNALEGQDMFSLMEAEPKVYGQKSRAEQVHDVLSSMESFKHEPGSPRRII